MAFLHDETCSSEQHPANRKTRTISLCLHFLTISCVFSTLLDTGIYDFNDHLLLGSADPTDRP